MRPVLYLYTHTHRCQELRPEGFGLICWRPPRFDKHSSRSPQCSRARSLCFAEHRPFPRTSARAVKEPSAIETLEHLLERMNFPKRASGYLNSQHLTAPTFPEPGVRVVCRPADLLWERTAPDLEDFKRCSKPTSAPGFVDTTRTAEGIAEEHRTNLRLSQSCKNEVWGGHTICAGKHMQKTPRGWRPE